MREKIINAVRRLAADRSVHQINMNDIAKEVGVSRQTIYRYVGNKSQINKLLSDNGVESEQNEVDTRSRILESAYRTFARYGYTQATLDQVAREAGFTKGAVYWHFKSKDELFIALLDQRLKHQLAYIPGELENVFNADNPVKGLANFFEKQFSFCESDPDWPKISLEFMTHSRNQDIQEKMNQAYRNVSRQITNLLHQMQADGKLAMNVAPSILTVVATSLLDGLVMAWTLYPGQVTPVKYSEEIATILWYGIAPKNDD